MKLNILTLNWNGKDKLEKLYPSLIKNLDGIDYTWHVRDNGSNDGSLEFLKNTEAKVLSLNHNRDSFACGVNSLWREAKEELGDLILLLNNDVVFNDNSSIKKMIELQNKTKAGAVGARLLYSGTNKLQHAGVIFGRRYGLLPYHYRHGAVNDKMSEKNRYFQAVTAACCLVTAESFSQIGGMDENFRWAFDDIDMCLSIGRTHKIAYCGSTNISHEESASLKKNPVNKMFQNSNVTYFKKKWFGNYQEDLHLYEKDPSYNVIE